MTREILFRGFHPCEDGDTTIYVEGEAILGQWVEGDYKMHSFQSLILPRGRNERLKVFPSTVGQYTGLTDKNGRKIFEGDIILAKDIGYKAVVEWQSDTCRFLAIITNQRDERSPHFFYVDKGNDRGCQMSSNEVIGTIWDNENEHER